MIIIIAYFVISIPILAVFFFIFYKSFLAIRQLSTRNQLSPELLQKYQTAVVPASEPDFIYHSVDEESDELAAVISTAISYYYAKQ